jgi:isopenicillin-N epimerase
VSDTDTQGDELVPNVVLRAFVDAADLRGEFLLDPEIVFLNHGSFGACPRAVFERYQAWQRELERRPVEFLARRLPELLAGVRKRLAAYVGARPDDLVLVPNATSGVNAVARSLRLEPGDEILATDHEYGACDLLWRHVCERAGARYVRAELPLPGPTAVAEAILGRLTERTRAVFLSHVTSPTALVLPVAEIAHRAREAGVTTIVDGAHGPAHVPVDVEALGADVYAATCHKWLCAPKGSGFLCVRPELQESIDASVIGWGYGDDATFVSRHTMAGTRDPAAYLSIPDAIDWQASHDWETVRERCRGLARAARARLAELTGLEPLSPDDRLGQMVAARLPDCDADALQRRLYDEHRIEVPASRRWNDTPLLRASFQAYNDERDLERLISALRELLP